MKLKLVTCIILTLAVSPLLGQNIKKCDGSVLLVTSDKIGELSHEEIKTFLLTLGKECKNNVEFSEWSNELLFSLLDKQTHMTLRAIEKEEKNLEMDEILDDISSPISDIIVVKNLISKVEKAKINSRLKKQILDRLKTADDK